MVQLLSVFRAEALGGRGKRRSKSEIIAMFVSQLSPVRTTPGSMLGYTIFHDLKILRKERTHHKGRNLRFMLFFEGS